MPAIVRAAPGRVKRRPLSRGYNDAASGPCSLAAAPPMDSTRLRVAFVASQDSSVALERALAQGLRARGVSVRFLLPASPGAADALQRQGELRWRSPALGPRPSRSLIDAAMVFPRARAAVDPDLTPPWLAVRERLLALRARSFLAELDREPVDRLVVWNGWHPEGRLAHLWSEERGVPCLHLENGLIPGRLQADFDGVNAASSFLSVPPDRWPAPVDPSPPVDPEGDAPIPVESLAAAGARQLVHRLIGRPLRPARLWRRPPEPAPPGRTTPPDRPFVLLALQLPDDTQLLLWSPPALRDPPSLVAPVRAAVSGALGEEVALAVKPHPLDRGAARIAAAVRRTPGCLLADGDVGPWLAASRAVVVLNSTVGMEAVVRERPVVAMAPSAYGIEGIVHRSRGLQGLAAGIRSAVEQPADAGLRARFLGLLSGPAGIPGERSRLFAASLPALHGLLAAGRHPWTGGDDG